jgi:hypothetical protein
MAAHKSPRSTKLYDQPGDEITLDEVEQIVIETQCVGSHLGWA